MGGARGDWRCLVPLCAECHAYQEGGRRRRAQVLEETGVDLVKVAARLVVLHQWELEQVTTQGKTRPRTPKEFAAFIADALTDDVDGGEVARGGPDEVGTALLTQHGRTFRIAVVDVDGSAELYARRKRPQKEGATNGG